MKTTTQKLGLLAALSLTFMVVHTACKDDTTDSGDDAATPDTDGGTTTAASCVDGVLNQGEEDVDCGGPCLACEVPARTAEEVATDICNLERTCRAEMNCSEAYFSTLETCVTSVTAGIGTDIAGAEAELAGTTCPFYNQLICTVPSNASEAIMDSRHFIQILCECPDAVTETVNDVLAPCTDTCGLEPRLQYTSNEHGLCRTADGEALEGAPTCTTDGATTCAEAFDVCLPTPDTTDDAINGNCFSICEIGAEIIEETDGGMMDNDAGM